MVDRTRTKLDDHGNVISEEVIAKEEKKDPPKVTTEALRQEIEDQVNGSKGEPTLDDHVQDGLNSYAGAIIEKLQRKEMGLDAVDLMIQMRIHFVHFDALIHTLKEMIAEKDPDAGQLFENNLKIMFANKLNMAAAEVKQPRIAKAVRAAVGRGAPPGSKAS